MSIFRIFVLYLTINILNTSYVLIYLDSMAATAIASKVGALSNLTKGFSGTNKLLAVAAINKKVFSIRKLRNKAESKNYFLRLLLQILTVKLRVIWRLAFLPGITKSMALIMYTLCSMEPPRGLMTTPSWWWWRAHLLLERQSLLSPWLRSWT